MVNFLRMGRFASDPDYTLRWPPEVLRNELQRLTLRARQYGESGEWREEVDLLLRQAFPSNVPVEDFRSLVTDESFPF